MKKKKYTKKIKKESVIPPRVIFFLIGVFVFLITTMIITFFPKKDSVFIPEVYIEEPIDPYVTPSTTPTPSPDIAYIYTQTQIPVMSIKMGPEKTPATSWFDVLLSTLRRK